MNPTEIIQVQAEADLIYSYKLPEPADRFTILAELLADITNRDAA